MKLIAWRPYNKESHIIEKESRNSRPSRFQKYLRLGRFSIFFFAAFWFWFLAPFFFCSAGYFFWFSITWSASSLFIFSKIRLVTKIPIRSSQWSSLVFEFNDLTYPYFWIVVFFLFCLWIFFVLSIGFFLLFFCLHFAIVIYSVSISDQIHDDRDHHGGILFVRFCCFDHYDRDRFSHDHSFLGHVTVAHRDVLSSMPLKYFVR